MSRVLAAWERGLGRPGSARDTESIGACLDSMALADAPEIAACAARHAGHDAAAMAALLARDLAAALRLD